MGLSTSLEIIPTTELIIMFIHQAQQLKNKDKVYDVLQRVYTIIGYSFAYGEGNISDITFKIQDQHNFVHDNVNYKVLYTSLDELSDPQIAFYKLVRSQTQKQLPIEIMPLDQLDAISEYFIQGFYTGMESVKK